MTGHTANPDRACPHENFAARVDVNQLARRIADLEHDLGIKTNTPKEV